VRYRIAAAAVAAYGVVLFVTGNLGWQHIALPVFIWACLAKREEPRGFLKDWYPMLAFWLFYDSMRAWGWMLYPRVAVEQPFRWEEALFLSPGGDIWPFYFARWTAASGSALAARLLQPGCSLVYLSYVFAVPVIMIVLWLRRSRILFRRMLLAFTVLNFLGLAIYVIYPAAPPWWVYENGFEQPTVEHSKPSEFKTGSTLSTLFQYSANRFGALPSLHGAHPFLLTLVLALHGARYRWIWTAGSYAALMWFSCVFLNQHYIVDLLAGAALTPFAVEFARLKNG